jgi:DNA-binding phage protein
MKINKQTKFELDLMEKLRDPEFASSYIMSAIVDNDMNFLPIALGDEQRLMVFLKSSKKLVLIEGLYIRSSIKKGIQVLIL